jgi:predicted transcriptional regulator
VLNEEITKRGKLFMATEVLKLTAQIVISHASLSELTPKELVEEIKDIFALLSSLEGAEAAAEAAPGVPEQAEEAEVVKKPPIPLDQIVKEKYVVCLECGKQMRTLKAHLRKTHKLLPKEYFHRYGLDPKKYPLVCQEYSEQRRKLAKEKGLGERGRRKATT